MKRSKFSLSHYKLLSLDMGELVPVGLTEVLPGDTIQQSTSALLRCSPLLAPVMHPVDVRIHHWFVPHRLVWDEWEDFITGGPDGMDASVFPTITFQNVPVGGLADYLGVPTGAFPGDLVVSALPFRGYAMIWNEWYRDQDLQTPLVIDDTSGPDTTTNIVLQNVAWEKDYFTASRPWEQKGPTISVPIGGSAPVTGTVTSTFRRAGVPSTLDYQTAGNASPIIGVSPSGAIGDDLTINSVLSGASANLASASAVTVTVLREALALQRYEEARARYGSRYIEYLRYLGVKSSDARLQRPEYLGGGRQKVQFSEVLQTAEGTDPVGEMKGHGLAAMRSNRYRKFFEEHGYVYSFMSVKPKTMYAQGLHRHWNRRFKEDFWQKELEHIGQQAILNKEIYNPHPSPDDTFGYADRYAEYRTTPSGIAGEFRTTLDFWHMARIFGTPPALNADFVKSVPTERTFAVPSTDVLWVMANHSIQARRMVSGSASSFIF